MNNKAKYFGGALYSDIADLNIKSINFMKNSAYAGGALFFDNNKFSLSEKEIKSIKYLNNSAESHGNDYSTNPFMVYLINNFSNSIRIKSGSYLPIIFNIIDKFNQTIIDKYKLYSNFILKINAVNNENNENVMLTGNSCIFYNGNQY